MRNRERRRQQARERPRDRCTTEQIGDRDGWVCWLCEDPIEQSYSYPDPRAPSVDHVRPLCDEGTSTLDNLRITHWACNHNRNSHEILTTLEEARQSKQRSIEVLSHSSNPVLSGRALDWVKSRDPEEILRQNRAQHSPQRYREKLAARIERWESEGR